MPAGFLDRDDRSRIYLAPVGGSAGFGRPAPSPMLKRPPAGAACLGCSGARTSACGQENKPLGTADGFERARLFGQGWFRSPPAVQFSCGLSGCCGEHFVPL